jgi:nucleoside-diphosphate-sugar epimerase
MASPKNVLVTGGAGYVGSALIPKLLAAGHHVKVLDLYMFGDDALRAVTGHPALEQIKGDMRDRALLEKVMPGCDAVIHLACISNDPSFELNPELGKSINYDGFVTLLAVSKDQGVRRFVYASSSSVYGVKQEEDVTEELALEPLTDYSKYKALCEDVLLKEQSRDFTTLVIRPATVCGYAPRLRLDLSVNILTNHAVNKGRITVFGGSQKRPNIHIEDMTDLYVQTLAEPDERIAGKVFNAGYENHTMNEIAGIVKDAVGGNPEVATAPTDDLRSYHISSAKIRRELGFEARHSIKEAAAGLAAALRDGRVPDPMGNPLYYNIKTMQNLGLR